MKGGCIKLERNFSKLNNKIKKKSDFTTKKNTKIKMASKYLQKYQVPEGFYDILHEFSREILRAQPEDILDYAANYFEHKC